MAFTKTKAKPAPKAVPQRAAPPQPTRAVAARASGDVAVPEYLRNRSEGGRGLSKEQSDNLVPLIYVLQSGSPQVKRGHEAMIEGAQAGDMWLRNAPAELQIVNGEDGVLFQPCAFWKDWVEWMPERKGFAGRHKERPPEASQVQEEGEDGNVRTVWRMPNGNQVVETRYHGGNVFLEGRSPLPYVIPLSSTGHSVSKAWMFAMNGEQIDGVDLDTFAVLYRLRTKLRQKNNWSWYQLDVQKERYAEQDEYDAGEKLHNAFRSGEKTADDEVSTEGDDLV